MESYDLDPSAPGQPRGHAQLAWIAVGLLALRLLVVAVITVMLAVDLLNG
ncbi:hypothetical protein [Streptomyces sp. SID4985]|nr:hypothetical protein [Streptomyces sp. SID4985]MYQ43712.1 hypothetical protein [Streptomyces sp. SID4985]